MRSLLMKSYLYSGDYKGTLAAIDKMPNSTPETNKIDQEVSKGLIVHFLCIIIYPADAKAGKAERLPSPCYELIRSKKHR